MFKPKTALPKPLTQWFRDPVAIDRLREILDDPVFQTAVATIKEAAGPSARSMATNPQANNDRLHWYAGYRDAFEDLAKLTRLPTTPKQTKDEWMHIQNP
jgi:hypothetical protein